MKKMIGVISILLMVLSSNAFCGDDQQNAISLFEKKIALFQDFYQKKPILIEKQKFPKSPTGDIFFYQKFSLINLTYDIRKTDSLVSPYSAYIDVSASVMKSNQCGDFTTYEGNKCFSTLEIARKNKKINNCFVTSSRSPDTVRFNFSFQKGKWVFKGLLETDNGYPRPGISTALGIPMNGRLPVEDNDHWKILIQ